jgi:hypothetical protein
MHCRARIYCIVAGSLLRMRSVKQSYMSPFQLHCPNMPPSFRLFPNPGLGHLQSSYSGWSWNWRNRAQVVFDRLERCRYGVRCTVLSLPARIRRSPSRLFLAANRCPATFDQRGLCLVPPPRLHNKTLQGIDSDETLQPVTAHVLLLALRAQHVLGNPSAVNRASVKVSTFKFP